MFYVKRFRAHIYVNFTLYSIHHYYYFFYYYYFIFLIIIIINTIIVFVMSFARTCLASSRKSTFVFITQSAVYALISHPSVFQRDPTTCVCRQLAGVWHCFDHHVDALPWLPHLYNGLHRGIQTGLCWHRDTVYHVQ